MTQAGSQNGYRELAVSFGRYLGAQLLVAISTLVALWIASRWGTASVDMIYLPAVMGAAIWCGFGPALAAAATSALAYDYFFTVPFYTFRIHGASDIVDVTMLFLIAVVTSQLTAAIQEQANIAEGHATRNATIAGFARRLLSSGDEAEIANSACEQISRIFVCNVIMMMGLPHPRPIAGAPSNELLSPTDIAAAVHTLRSGEVAGHGAACLSPAEWLFYPIKSGKQPLAAVGLARDDGSDPIRPEQQPLLESLLDQTALALTRARSADEPPRRRSASR
jgi:K+-sensing histidine kinase KdpD